MPKDNREAQTSQLRFNPLKKNAECNVLETAKQTPSIVFQLPPLPKLIVKESARHKAKMIGALPERAGHRVTGPLTQSVYKFIGDKYLRYYANLDGVLRYFYLKAEGNTKKILARYVDQFLSIMKSNGELTNMAPTKWENGKAKAILSLVNTLNRRRDDVSCPLNDLNLVRILSDRTHPKFPDACRYLKHHDVGGVFFGLYSQFQSLVVLLAKDVREYDLKITLNSGGFGYDIEKEAYLDVKDYILAKANPSSPVARILDLELVYDEAALLSKIKLEEKELVYVKNLRVLYLRNPAISCTFFQGTPMDVILENNYHQITYHGYQKIAGGFVATPNGEPESMELIKTNMATLECHMRPKFGRFFLNYKRSGGDHSYNITITEDASERTFTTTAVFKTRIQSATFVGYVSNDKMVLTDLLRVDGREVNIDITRANFDSDGSLPFLSSNVFIRKPIGDDRDCYDLLLRSEYGVFRARSLVKTRIYDKIGWFYDYLQTFGLASFKALYEIKEPSLKKIIDLASNLVENKLTVTTEHRDINAIMDEIIVTMDNRFAPPLIINFTYAKRRAEHSKFNKQNLNGNVFQLNKYYVISRSSSLCFSIDAPPVPFVESYSDDYCIYKSEKVNLATTNFARFPSVWTDEIYQDGVIRYDKYLNFKKKEEQMEFYLDNNNDAGNSIEIYQPFHDTPEENFIAKFTKMQLEIEPTILIKKAKRGGKTKRDQTD